MIGDQRIPLDRLVVAFSRTLDLVHPEMQEHQLRVAYICTCLAQVMGFSRDELLDLFVAASLHDIGMTSADEEPPALGFQEPIRIPWHTEVGYELLRGNPVLATAASIIRHHHVPWAHGRGAESRGQLVPLASNIIALADGVERTIKPAIPVLEQAEQIAAMATDGAGELFHPQVVEAFRQCATGEVFWLDCVSKKIESLLLSSIDTASVVIDEVALQSIAKIFAHLVDGMSPWTATHSAGVAGASLALARELKFSPREQVLMRTAGYLHDLGKLSVPPAILDKPGKLTGQEWAILKGHTYYTFQILELIGGLSQLSEWSAFHHERLDGNGYPFHRKASQLTLGSRIMAVADVFTALTEDRPYRQGAPPIKTLSILDELSSNGGLDGDVVDLIKTDHEAVITASHDEQVGYKEQHDHLSEFVGSASAA
jgi:HD-GYP domain-containing protein (c-di-GMP phosphodiesterase class II)